MKKKRIIMGRCKRISEGVNQDVPLFEGIEKAKALRIHSLSILFHLF